MVEEHAMKISQSVKGPTNVILDSSFFGQVLVSGPQIPAFLTSLARDGKIFLFLPWIVLEEVKTNIPQWTQERLFPRLKENIRREFRKCNLDPSLTEEAEAATRQTYQRACDEIAARFNEWRKQSMCDTLPLSLEECEGAWASYFRGDAPMDTPKNKSHLPDAHIFHSIKAFAETRGHCAFVCSDNNLAEHAAALEGVEVYRTPSDLFEALGLSTTYKAAKASMPKLTGLTLTAEQIAGCVHDGLLNRRLSVDGKDWSISAVSVTATSTRQQSATPMLESNLLVGVTASADLKLISKTKTGTEIRTEKAETSIEIEGGLVVNAASLTAELDEYTLLSAPVISAEELSTSPCDAVVALESYHEKSSRDFLAGMPPGVIFVTGGNINERRKMAEWLSATLCTVRNAKDFALRLFPLHEPLAEVHAHNPDSDKLHEFVRKKSVDVVAVEESKTCRIADVLRASAYNRAYVICALASCTGTDAVIRAVADANADMDGLGVLEAVVNFTKRTKRGAVFNFHIGSQWAGPRWAATLNRDAMLRGYQQT